MIDCCPPNLSKLLCGDKPTDTVITINDVEYKVDQTNLVKLCEYFAVYFSGKYAVTPIQIPVLSTVDATNKAIEQFLHGIYRYSEGHGVSDGSGDNCCYSSFSSFLLDMYYVADFFCCEKRTRYYKKKIEETLQRYKQYFMDHKPEKWEYIGSQSYDHITEVYLEFLKRKFPVNIMKTLYKLASVDVSLEAYPDDIKYVWYMKQAYTMHMESFRQWTKTRVDENTVYYP